MCVTWSCSVLYSLTSNLYYWRKAEGPENFISVAMRNCTCRQANVPTDACRCVLYGFLDPSSNIGSLVLLSES